jgi:cysteine desulfuration protein SufE
MVAHLDPATGRLGLRADSDAFIVKGLISLLLRLYAGRAPDEILANPPKVLEEIGLARHLTPGRSNGLWSMVKRIRELAALAEAERLAAAE